MRSLMRACLFVLPTVPVSLPAATNLLQGMVAYYPFDEGSGTTTSDVATTDGISVGTLVGSAQFTTGGRNGSGALLLPAAAATGLANANALKIPDSVELDPEADVSIAFWFSCSSYGGGKGAALLQKGSGSNVQFRMYVDGSNLVTRARSVKMRDFIPGLADGDWVHVTWTHSASDGKEQIFLNGRLVASNNDVSFTINHEDMYLGYGDAQTRNPINLKIDDLRIFHRVVDPSEVPLIAGVDTTPVPEADAFVALQGAPVSFELMANDLEDDSLTFAITTAPAHGALTPTLNNAVWTYTPAPGYAGTDSFSWTVSDGNTTSPPVMSNLTVLPLGTLLAPNLAVHTTEDQGVALSTLSALALPGISVSVTTHPAHGKLSGKAPALVYTPDPDFNGLDSLGYTLTGPGGITATGLLVIKVSPVNDPPVVQDKTVAATENTPLSFGVPWSEPEHDAIDMQITEAPQHGTATIEGEKINYTPDADYTGTDSLKVMATDSHGLTAEAQMHIAVCAPGVFPVTLFGANPDGSTDSTDAVVEALAGAAKNGGGEVYFPQGTYKMIAVATATITMYGKHDGAWVQYDTADTSAHIGSWHFHTFDPLAGFGADGDSFVNLKTGAVFHRVAGTWEPDGLLSQDAGTGWESGCDAPNDSVGSDGDVFLMYRLTFQKSYGTVLITQANNGTRIAGDGDDKSILTFRCWGDVDPMDYSVDTSTTTILSTHIPKRTDGSYVRGTLFVLAKADNSAFDDIEFSGLRMSGNTTANGKNGWTSNYHRLEEWDISNKCIILPTDSVPATNIKIKDCYLDGWRGEIIYKGGGNLVSFEVDNTKIAESNGSAISTSAICMVNNCEIWNVYNGFENYSLNGQSTEIRNTTVDVNRTLPYGAGDYAIVYLGVPSGHLIVDHCTLKNANAALFLSDFADNVTFTNNQIYDCGIGVYSIYLNLYGLPPQFNNVLIDSNTMTMTTTNASAFVTSYNGSGEMKNWIIQNNVLQGTGGHYVSCIARLTHPGPWALRDPFIIQDNTVYDGAIMSSDRRGFRPLLYNNVVIAARKGQFNNSFSSTAATPMTIYPTWDQVMNDVEGDGKPVLIGDLNLFPVGFEFNIFGNSSSEGCEIIPDAASNSLTRGYMIYNDSSIRLRFNESGKFELVSYTHRPGTPLTITSGTNIWFAGYESVTLNPSQPTTYTTFSGLPYNVVGTINYNANVTFAHSVTSPAQMFQISAPGGADYKPGTSGSLQVIKLPDGALYFLPKFTSESADKAIDEFTGTTLSSSVFGSGPVSYQWYWGNVGDKSHPVASGTGAGVDTGIIKDTRETKLWLEATTPTTTLQGRQITLTINPVPPTITGRTEDHEVDEFSDTQLTVDSYGTAPLTYQWYAGATGDTSAPIDGADAPTYDIASIRGLGQKQFWVRVTNDQGHADSGTININVNPIAPVITGVDGTLDIDDFSSTKIHTDNYGSGTLSYQWYQGESGDTSTPLAAWWELDTGELSGVSSVDYWLRITNEYGHTDSDTITVTLKPIKPVVTHINSGEQLEFKSAGFKVSYYGTGTSSVTWYESSDGGHETLVGRGEVISLPPLHGVGIHTLRAEITNSAGTTNALTTVKVLPAPPVITGLTQGKEVNEYDSVDLAVAAYGTAPLTYQWYIGTPGDTDNSMAVDGLTEASTTFSPIRGIGTRTYWVRVSNDVGQADSAGVTFTVDPIAPVIASVDGARDINDFSSTSLTTDAYGSGTLSYQWYLGQAGDTSTPLTSAPQIDTGVHTNVTRVDYWTRVTSEYGTADSDTISVNVTPIKPVVTYINSGQQLEFKSAGFHVSYYGTGTSTVTWYESFGGAPETIVGTGDTVSLPPLHGIGVHTLRAEITNSVGITNAITTVKVLAAPPVITGITQSQEVNEFDAVALNVAAYGTAPLSYQWYIGTPGDTGNSVAVDGLTGASTTLSPIMGIGARTYWVRISNDVGHVDSSGVTLTVDPIAPVITAIDGERSIDEFGSTSFTASAYGSGTLTYQWYRGVAGDTSQPLAAMPELATGSLSGGSSADFWLRASNQYGHADSSTVHVLLAPIKPVVTHINSGQQYEFKSAGFKVTYYGSGTSSVTWYQSFEGGPETMVGTGDIVSVPNLKGVGTHTIRAEITNSAGTTSVTTTLKVIPAPPAITSVQYPASVQDGASGSLDVAATGSYTLTWEWYRHQGSGPDELVATTPTGHLDTGTLTYPGNWVYSVKISSDAGTVTGGPYAINVAPIPVQVTQQPESGAVGPGMPFKLTVAATGTGPLTYQWFLGNGIVDGQTSATLDVPSMSAGLAGNYTCHVSGASGTVISDVGAVSLDDRTGWVSLDPTGPDSLSAWTTALTPGGEVPPTDEGLELTSNTYLGLGSSVLALHPDATNGIQARTAIPTDPNLSQSTLYFRFYLPGDFTAPIDASLFTDDSVPAEAVQISLQRVDTTTVQVSICGTPVNVGLPLGDKWIDVWLLIDNQLDQVWVLALPASEISTDGLTAANTWDALQGPFPFCASTQASLATLAYSIPATDAASAPEIDSIAFLPQGMRLERPFDISLWDSIPTDPSGWKPAPIGWIYDGYYPWIWHGVSGAWMYVLPGSTTPSMWLYELAPDGGPPAFIWTSEANPGWHFIYGAPTDQSWLKW